MAEGEAPTGREVMISDDSWNENSDEASLALGSGVISFSFLKPNLS